MELTSTTTQHDLIVNVLTKDIYNELCASGNVSNEELYLVKDEDGFDAENLPITNVPEPKLSGDAVNKDYVDRLSDVYQEKGNYLTAHQSLSDYYTKSQTNALSTTFRNGLVDSTTLTAYETKADLTSNYYTKNDLSTASQITTALSQKQPVGNYLTSIQAGNGISVDGNTVGLSVHTTAISVDGTYTTEFFAKHVSVQEYAQILEEGALSNALYIISSDENDMMGERIINVADPVELSDAVNKKYVDDIIGNIETLIESI